MNFTHLQRVFQGGLAASILLTATLAAAQHQATGIRIGEVTDSTAVVWTRLTKNPERIGFDGPVPIVRYRDPDTGALVTNEENRNRTRPPVVTYPDGATIDTIQGACPGARGDVRVLYRAAGSTAWSETPWQAVDETRDFTRQFALAGLAANTRYELRVESRAPDGSSGDTFSGGFKTAPSRADAVPVTFTVSTGQRYYEYDRPDGFKIYPEMEKLNPDFFVHTGDIVYYDEEGKDIGLARWHWARTYSLPTQVKFHANVASYFIKDDHDTWQNDCWPGMQSPYMGDFTFEQGQAVFLEQVPMGDSTYRTVRWGRDLQVWFVEGRDFRSPNTMPDGPDKTIWGAEQMAWFKRTVAESDASFRVLVSPTPVVGPDRTNKADNHSNRAFTHEGKMLREFIASQSNMYIACGDRHWQYVSVDADTNLREYSCGPATDEHAGGWSNDQLEPAHRYLNVVGGFLAVTVTRENGAPVLYARHYSVDGAVLNEDRRELE